MSNHNKGSVMISREYLFFSILTVGLYSSEPEDIRLRLILRERPTRQQFHHPWTNWQG